MAYSEEALKTKLSTLNETQDSIVSVSQWITFHKRHADKIANYWLTRLRDAPPPKRLNFIYLVNDIVQNARARKRTEFPDAFAPLMPEAIQTAYRSSPAEVQNKIRRVVEVWRTRAVFEVPIQSAIEARLDEADKTKGSSGKKTLMGNSLFNSSSSTGLPKELETLSPLQIAVTKATVTARPSIDTAQTEYTKLNDPEAAVPSPPVYAARLSSLMKSLANAESSLSASIKARQALISDLERILEINKSALAKDEETYMDLSSRRTSTEAKKREVEDNIMRGLSADVPVETTELDSSLDVNDMARSASASTTPFNPERPDFEELTPDPDANDNDDFYQPQYQTSHHNPHLQSVLAGFSSPPNQISHAVPSFTGGSNGNGMTSRIRPTSSDHSPSTTTNGFNNAKRRKLSHGDSEQGIMPDFGEMGIDIGDFDAGAGAGSSGIVNANDMSRNTNTDSNDLLQSLDDDVNDLIRQEGS